MKKYALIGAAGFVAPRHMRAIYETGGQLVAACDISDSVGILDSYFPDCEFFTSPERFQRYLMKRLDIDYFVVCTPNYLHDAHILMGLMVQADVICEKPMVIKPNNVKHLADIASKLGKKINVIQQMRLHPALQKLEIVLGARYNVKLIYNTPRGPWYHRSWKGDKEKSGGLAMNIGVHFFDLLIQLFGLGGKIRKVVEKKEYIHGKLEYDHADIFWFLSTFNDKPKRLLVINGETINLSQGFEDLHTKSYEEILAGRGFGPEDVLPSLELINNL